MSIKIDINVCRVCCKSEAPHAILQYAQKFLYCTGLEIVENDGLPDKICATCLERMKSAADFKKKSEHSDRQLRNFIANVNNQFHMTLVISENDDDGEDEIATLQVTEVKKVSSIGEGNMEVSVLTSQTNSALGTKGAQIAGDTGEPEIEVIQEVQEPTQEPETEPHLGFELQQEQRKEKFRAVAVIQEKPLVEPKKELFEVVEVDYDDGILPQGMESDELEQTDDQMDDTEETEQVIYISIPDQYCSEPKLASASDETVTDNQEEENPAKSPELEQIEEFKYEIKQQTNHPGKLSATNKSAINGQFECTQCAKFFSTKTNLNRHLQAHDGNKPYVCHLCQKGFTQNGSLKQHLLIHQNIRPFVCNVCGQGFSQQKSLTFHMRRHTNEKPFVCPHCQFAFRQKDGLKRHVLVKHTARDAKTFNCTQCPMTFGTRYGLATHRKRHEIASAAAAEGVPIVMKD
ncbi:zinc finger and SCAN domain-containing protein 12-like [Sabethes cyaneus]|uniref:zinc finger and SCAN domain-containing protein 12-like n=1 Tax=Sabethes cyaneus TaxID=53552 RepID=UPI00237E9A25|nr:zinc finger and SCAN domain-containing protein 12-like [Sabethes cyaneus]